MNLLQVMRRFESDCAYVDCLVIEGLRNRTTANLVFESCIAHAIIRLHDAWAYRCRSAVLCSANGGAIRGGGVRVARAVNLGWYDSPLEYLRQHWSRHGPQRVDWEPHWHIPADAIRAASILAVANEVTIQAGLGACTVANELRVVRNVVAHRVPGTWRRLQKLRLQTYAGFSLPVHYATIRSARTGVRPIDAWMADMKACLAAALT
jgi:hypothetical protein